MVPAVASAVFEQECEHYFKDRLGRNEDSRAANSIGATEAHY